MSDVLGSIAKRLQTDLADVARASIDPTFSRQLTEANFRDKELAQQRQDAILKRQQALADKEKEQKFDIQKTILMGAHQRALDDPTGKIVSPSWMDFMKVGKHLEDPKLQQAWGMLAEGVGGRSAEANQTIFDNVLNLEKDMRDKVKFEYSPENRARNELVYDKWDDDYQAMQDKLNAQNFDRQGLIGLLRGSYGVFDEDEKNNIISRMTEATSDQEAKDIYNTAINAGDSRFQEQRGITPFPESFGPATPWVNDKGEVLGTKQKGPDGKWHYKDDPSKRAPLVSMGAGAQADIALEEFKEAREKAQFAEKQLNSLDFIETTIGDMETGLMTDFKVGVNQLASSLNLPFSGDVPNLEAARTAAGELVMDSLQKFPGQISNAEREFLEKRMPGLTQTKEGRQLIIDMLRRSAEREIKRRQLMQPYINRPEPTFFPEGEKSYWQVWDEYRDNNPIWQDIPMPDGGVKMDTDTNTLYYESLDGKYRDKNRELWRPVTETIDRIPGAQ